MLLNDGKPNKIQTNVGVMIEDNSHYKPKVGKMWHGLLAMVDLMPGMWYSACINLSTKRKYQKVWFNGELVVSENLTHQYEKERNIKSNINVIFFSVYAILNYFERLRSVSRRVGQLNENEVNL